LLAVVVAVLLGVRFRRIYIIILAPLLVALAVLSSRFLREVISAAFWASLDNIGQSPGTLFFSIESLGWGAYFVVRRRGFAALKGHLVKVGMEIVFVGILAWAPFFMWQLIAVPRRVWGQANQVLIPRLLGRDIAAMPLPDFWNVKAVGNPNLQKPVGGGATTEQTTIGNLLADGRRLFAENCSEPSGATWKRKASPQFSRAVLDWETKALAAVAGGANPEALTNEWDVAVPSMKPEEMATTEGVCLRLSGEANALEQILQRYLKPVTPVPIQHAYDLTGQRRARFLELLKTSPEPRDTVRIGCIAWSESACVAAGKFLILFSEAGWKIDQDHVFRLEPSVPIEGVAIVSYPEPGEPLPPHLGRWHKMSASQVTIWTTFNQLGVAISGSSDASLPPTGVTGIYFGPEPHQVKQQ